MLAISRFRYDDAAPEAAEADLRQSLEALGRCGGFVGGAVGRALDDPGLWVLETRWDSVGSYRRAWSSYEIKATVVPLLSAVIDEPSAFEVVVGEGSTPLNESRPRGKVAW